MNLRFKDVEKQFIVVDDDPTSNMICKFAITRLFANVKVDLFTDPQKALDVIATMSGESLERQKVLFLDLNMPLISGWDFLEKFKKLASDIKQHFTIYILTSSIDHRDKEKAAANSLVSGFISKPLTADLLKKLNLA